MEKDTLFLRGQNNNLWVQVDINGVETLLPYSGFQANKNRRNDGIKITI